MINIDLSNAPQRMNKAFRPLVNDQHRVIVCVGGASSSKSYSYAQKVVYKMLAEKGNDRFKIGHRFLMTRKVGRTLRHSIYEQMKTAIRDWDFTNLFSFNDSALEIKCKINSNDMVFSGLDDVQKLKSIVGVTDICMEEAPEDSEADFNQLDLRVRGPSLYKKQITLLANPISIQHWIKHRFYDRVEDDCLTHHSTYLDNDFLDYDTIKRLEKITDPYYRDVYVLGKWGVYGNTVFSNFVIEDFDYTADDLEQVSNGIDFGTVHAAVYLRLGFKDDDIYVFDECYGKGWTNPDFIQAVEDYFGEECHEWPVTADSAEKDRIMEFERAGFRLIEPAKKGPGSLGYGVDFLRAHKVHIHATRCPHTALEFQQFKRMEDKRTGEVLDDHSFVEVNDDCIAGARYATERLWGEYQVNIPTEWGAEDLGL